MVFNVNVQLPEARGNIAARLEREDLRMGSDIWKLKNISRICSIFQTMWVQFKIISVPFCISKSCQNIRHSMSGYCKYTSWVSWNKVKTSPYQCKVHWPFTDWPFTFELCHGHTKWLTCVVSDLGWIGLIPLLMHGDGVLRAGRQTRQVQGSSLAPSHQDRGRCGSYGEVAHPVVGEGSRPLLPWDCHLISLKVVNAYLKWWGRYWKTIMVIP